MLGRQSPLPPFLLPSPSFCFFHVYLPPTARCRYEGAVLCVKWSSKTGQYLATGSDDKIIVIWVLDTPLADVADLAWSPDNRYLASCGLDSKVIIWHGQTFEMLRKLDQHHGFVKGVAWDPIGKYLATQSDDKSTILWRVADWQIEKTITTPYAKSTSTTFFCRPSWSPDGVQLVTANASNKGVSSAAVIQRDTWKSDVHFIGHDEAVEVVRFNPRLFRLSATDEDAVASSPIGALCAIGSQDRTISFWITSRPRSLMVAHDIFNQGVLDMAWSADGRVVYACSLDGSVTVIQLGEHEVGTPLTSDEQEEHFSSLGLQMQSVELAETPEQLDMEQARNASKDAPPANRLATLMGSSSTAAATATATTTNEDSIEPMQITMAAPPLQSKAVDTAAAPPPSSLNVTEPDSRQHNTPPKQKVTITADGRRRIQPQFIRGLTTPSSATAPSFPAVPPTPTPATPGLRMATSDQFMAGHPAVEMDPPSRAMPPGGLECVVMGRKRPAHEMHEPADRHGSKILAKYSTETRATLLAPELAVASIRLSVPKVHSVFSRSRATDKSWVFECHNTIAQQPGAAQIICSREGQICWKQLLPSAILLLVASSLFSAAACEDGTVHVFSPHGRRLLPSLCLNAPPSFLDCNGRYLLCLTSVGQLFVWDIVEREAVMANASIAALLHSEQAAASSTTTPLASAVTITDACVHANGIPVLCTSNGCAYAYDQGMRTWTRIVDAWYAASEYYAPVATALNAGAGQGGPLTVAQVTAERTCTDRARIQRSDRVRLEQRQQTLLSIDHLE
ncbi:WD40-repeat-containing domain protein, partial [Syncephalis pseudoplumigaleata]